MNSPKIRTRITFDSENPMEAAIYNFLAGKSLRARNKILKYLIAQSIKEGLLAKSEVADDVEDMIPQTVSEKKPILAPEPSVRAVDRPVEKTGVAKGAPKGNEDLSDFGG